MRKHIKTLAVPISAFALLFATAFTATGCDTKEKVLDVETPGGDVEIERDTSTGAVGVEVDKE